MKSYKGNNFSYDGQGRLQYLNMKRFHYNTSDQIIATRILDMDMFYDESGLVGFKYSGLYYFYKKDLFGNIAAILDSNRAVVVQYVYDAWGNHKVLNADGTEVAPTEMHIGNINPFRYRGYYYDIYTGLYYLKSRYYDPQTGRFINMDGVEYADPPFLNGLNLYAYCNNNPVMYVDPNGNFAITISLVSAGLVAFASLLIGTGLYYLAENIEPLHNIKAPSVDNTQHDSIKEDGDSTLEVLDKREIVEYLNYDIFFSKSYGGGRDSGFIGTSDGELEEKLKNARQRGDTKEIMRIIRELKNRGQRNKRKNRKGPHMRGWLLFVLIRWLKGEINENL